MYKYPIEELEKIKVRLGNSLKIAHAQRKAIRNRICPDKRRKLNIICDELKQKIKFIEKAIRCLNSEAKSKNL